MICNWYIHFLEIIKFFSIMSENHHHHHHHHIGVIGEDIKYGLEGGLAGAAIGVCLWSNFWTQE